MRRGQILREMLVNIAQHYQGLPSFTVTLHTENNWKCCGPAELLNVLKPIQNQPEAAMASWQLKHPTPTEGDSGDWTVAMRKVLKNILHYVGEDPETYAASVLSVQRPVSATGPVTTPRRRLAPTGQASTSTAPTASDNTGTTDPTPTETTGYSDGETDHRTDESTIYIDSNAFLTQCPTSSSQEAGELLDMAGMGEKEAFWTYVVEKIGPQYATMQQHAGVPGTSSGHQATFGHVARDCEETVAFHVDSLQRFLKAACPSAATGVLTAIKKHGGCRSIKTIFANDKHESGSRVKTGSELKQTKIKLMREEQYEAAKTAILQSDPSVKNKSVYIEDVRLDYPASLKVRDIVIIDPGRKQHDANEPWVVVVMEKAPTGRQQKEEYRRSEKYMRFREDHVYEEIDPDDVMERFRKPLENEEYLVMYGENTSVQAHVEKPAMYMIARCSSSDADQLCYSQERRNCLYKMDKPTRARAVSMQNDLMTLTANGDETSSSLLKRKRTIAHNARVLNNKNAVGTYQPKPLQVGQWLAVAYKEGHYVGIVKAKIKFFDYRGGGQYTPPRRPPNLLTPILSQRASLTQYPISESSPQSASPKQSATPAAAEVQLDYTEDKNDGSDKAHRALANHRFHGPSRRQSQSTSQRSPISCSPSSERPLARCRMNQKYDVEVDMSEFESLYENVTEGDLIDPRVEKMPVALKEYPDQHLQDENYDNDNGRSGSSSSTGREKGMEQEETYEDADAKDVLAETAMPSKGKRKGRPDVTVISVSRRKCVCGKKNVELPSVTHARDRVAAHPMAYMLVQTPGITEPEIHPRTYHNIVPDQGATMVIPSSLGKRQRLTDDSGDQTSLTDLLNTCIKETRELDSQTESAVLGLHDHTAPTEPEAQSPKSGFPGGWTAVDLTMIDGKTALNVSSLMKVADVKNELEKRDLCSWQHETVERTPATSSECFGPDKPLRNGLAAEAKEVIATPESVDTVVENLSTSTYEFLPHLQDSLLGVIGDQATCKNIRGVRRFRQDDVDDLEKLTWAKSCSGKKLNQMDEFLHHACEGHLSPTEVVEERTEKLVPLDKAQHPATSRSARQNQQLFVVAEDKIHHLLATLHALHEMACGYFGSGILPNQYWRANSRHPPEM
ncbi:hypothetical protein Bbelb_283310 [Branchiostoma belcheri]|nr:hypothetical protein Bbelb_283310 [Branchiostoma belcheri]